MEKKENRKCVACGEALSCKALDDQKLCNKCCPYVCRICGVRTGWAITEQGLCFHCCGGEKGKEVEGIEFYKLIALEKIARGITALVGLLEKDKTKN